MNVWRIGGWGLAGGLLAFPAAAMLAGAQVDWGPEDFIAAGVLIGAAGLALEAAIWLSRPLGSGARAYRAAAALCALATLLTLWANAAVGIIGDEANPANRLFALVPAVALAGGLLARFRPAGLAWAAAAAGVAHFTVPALADGSPPATTWMMLAAMAGPWMAAAWLFRRSAVHAGGATERVR